MTDEEIPEGLRSLLDGVGYSMSDWENESLTARWLILLVLDQNRTIDRLQAVIDSRPPVIESELAKLAGYNFDPKDLSEPETIDCWEFSSDTYYKEPIGFLADHVPGVQR